MIRKKEQVLYSLTWHFPQVEIRIFGFDNIRSLYIANIQIVSDLFFFFLSSFSFFRTHLFGNHIHRILDPTVRNNRDHRRINHPQVPCAVDHKPGIDHTLVDILRESARATRVYHGLVT